VSSAEPAPEALDDGARTCYRRRMLMLEFKLAGTSGQYRALDEAIRTTQFIRNKCVRYWQDTRGTTPSDLNKYCAILA
jgi:putative transposase